MCGIYGMVSLTGEPLRCPERMEELGRELRHRGPDAHGIYRSDTAALGVERLRIIDRRPAADQPFATERSVLVCNGEIYNDHDLRRLTGSHRYRSRSDVEPLLPLLEREGPRALKGTDGMFALAHWTVDAASLTLARDPAGEKPLYYLVHQGEVWFASEIRALLHHPTLVHRLDREGLEAFLALGYIPEPTTLFNGINKVPAGTCLVFSARSAPGKLNIGYDAPTGPTTVDEIDRALRRSVARRCRADVPLGLFLSGGLDSSLVTALTREAKPRDPLHSFSAKFAAPSFDESANAARVAGMFGTVHHEVVIDEGVLRATLDRVVAHGAEPLADPALLPTVALAQEARRHVGVVLSGEGADELFGGYPTYQGHVWAERLAMVPERWWHRARRLVGAGAASHQRVPAAWLIDRFLTHATEGFLSRHLAWQAWGVMPLLPPRHRRELALRWAPEPAWGRSKHIPDAVRAMDLDMATALRDSLLVKLDRASMMFGLEARAPFVSRDLTSAARGLAPKLRATAFRGKVALRRVAGRYVPPGVLRRPKRGLSVPVATWLNRGLRAEVDRLWASPGMELIQGVFPDVPIPQLLWEHRSGSRNHARPIWTVITLLYWVERWGLI